MKVKVLKTSIEHNGNLYIRGNIFEIKETEYKEIEKFVSVEKEIMEKTSEIQKNNFEQGINFSKMSIADLKKYAAEREIALIGKNKTDIIAELEKYE